MARDTGAALSAASRRFQSQLLSGPPASGPLQATERLLAIQAQDPRGARLAIRARTSGASAEDVDRALTEERSLVITSLNRGTLHLVRSEDYPWIQALTTPPLFTGSARRLAQEGVAPDAAERAVAVIQRALAADGPLTRAQLYERIGQAGIRTAGQAGVHLLLLACLRGVAVRGPMIGRQHAYALVDDWLGRSAPVDRDRALAELARRYLAGHAPAGDRDLAKWAGLPLRDARAALAAIAPQLSESEDGLLELRGAPRDAEPPPSRLLGSFDPVLLGWSSREFVIAGRQHAIVSGGIFRPFALVGGLASAVWRIRDSKVWIEPLRELEAHDEAALRADGEAVVRYLGL